MTSQDHDCDVLILGAGLAGLSLARHLLLEPGAGKIVLVDRRELPKRRQQVGEATVQVSGYYFSRVLGLEEHLLQEHYLKYNLRFWWPTSGTNGGDRAERYSQSYLRNLSNIATYQLDRNKLEDELLRLNVLDPRFELIAPFADLEIDLGKRGSATEHHVFRGKNAQGETITGRADWVVDASGRARVLAKKLDLTLPSPIRHGTTFLWVEGLLDPEKLTDLSPKEIRLHPSRSQLGHMPYFLATNHFCDDGMWFWVIPLHGKTSLGLVYDRERVPRERVATAEKLVEWICEKFPLFARDLPQRKILEWSGFKEFSHDCRQILSADRWALSGEAGRFSDPLYSPGGDLISLQNTLIVDAILSSRSAAGVEQLPSKVRLYDVMARAFHDAYVPSYSVSYDTLGDQEAYSLRYAWELAIYFAFYVFPFINDLFTEPTFGPGFLRRFAKLGPLNTGVHPFLVDFLRWKRERGVTPPNEPAYFDFSSIGPLAETQGLFFEVGVDAGRARQLLDETHETLERLMRFIVAHVSAVVVDDDRVLSHPDFIEGIDLSDLRFDPQAIERRWELLQGQPCADTYEWGFDPLVLRRALRGELSPCPIKSRRKGRVTKVMAPSPTEPRTVGAAEFAEVSR